MGIGQCVAGAVAAAGAGAGAGGVRAGGGAGPGARRAVRAVGRAAPRRAVLAAHVPGHARAPGAPAAVQGEGRHHEGGAARSAALSRVAGRLPFLTFPFAVRSVRTASPCCRRRTCCCTAARTCRWARTSCSTCRWRARWRGPSRTATAAPSPRRARCSPVTVPPSASTLPPLRPHALTSVCVQMTAAIACGVSETRIRRCRSPTRIPSRAFF